MTIRKSSSSGIPFGNTAGRPANANVGQPYFNGEIGRLELKTSASWENIVSETPGVISVSSTPGAVGAVTLNITGTNFTSGAIASLTGTNGVEIQASSTTVNSIVSVTASFTGLSYLNDPYDLKVTNTSNLFGLLPDAVNVNQTIVWQTAAGSLGTFNEQSSITLSALSATDPESATISYSLANGSALPSGVTLNSATGVISGILPDTSTDTTYTFSVNATDGANTVSRSFSISSIAQIAVDYLVVAGGGAGGSNKSGGGGAGGLRSSVTATGGGGTLENALNINKNTNVIVTVGLGGNGTSASNGANGSSSVFSTVTSLGGGGGGHYDPPTIFPGNAGGSGGGGAGSDSNPGNSNGGSGTANQGYSGGNGPFIDTSTAAGGGGGGAGQSGSNGGGSSLAAIGGKGGDGVAVSITGTSVTYAGGGGGGVRSGTAGAGGTGGGGAGDTGNFPVAGTTNTGGGGGASGQSGAPGAAGGSGVVILRWLTSAGTINVGSGLTSDATSTTGSYSYKRFTAGTGNVSWS